MKIYIAGDSTAAEKNLDKRPETGWGENLGAYFERPIEVVNHAVNGRSTKSFIAENRLAKLESLLEPGDYLFIQFGHNDQKVFDPSLYTNPHKEYLTNLLKFADVAFKKEATPVFITSVTRRDYLTNDQLNPDTLGDYPSAMRKLAKINEITLIDCFKVSQDYFNQLTKEETKKFFLHGAPKEFSNYDNGISDDTHFQELGAQKIAELIALEILKSDLPLRKYIDIASLVKS